MFANDVAQRRQIVDRAHFRFRRGHARREPQRRDQARRIGLAGAGNVEGGAVIRRGADERQSERDVDGVLEGDGLDRDQRLVVIHADRAVIGLARGVVEHGVRRQRAASLDALGAQGFDGRRDDVDLFGAERAVFAGMRIEAGDDEARMGEAETGLQILDHDAGGRDDQFARQLRERLAQRQMDRHRHDGKRRRPQHHHRLRGRPPLAASSARNSVWPGWRKPAR